MPKQNKGEGDCQVLQAKQSPAAKGSQPDYPPPPGYRIEYHVTREIGDEMALFLAAPASNYGGWLMAAAAHKAASPQDTTTPAVGQLVSSPILESA